MLNLFNFEVRLAQAEKLKFILLVFRNRHYREQTCKLQRGWNRCGMSLER